MSNLSSMPEQPAGNGNISVGAAAAELQGASLEKLREMLSQTQQAALGDGKTIARGGGSTFGRNVGPPDGGQNGVHQMIQSM